jgi:uncharacterized membrane protein YkoI
MKLSRLLLTISLLFAISPPTALAGTGAWDANANLENCLIVAQQGSLSAQQAADIAQQKYGGRVLKIKPDGKLYRIKLLLDSGHVIQVTVDADSGALSKS